MGMKRQETHRYFANAAAIPRLAKNLPLISSEREAQMGRRITPSNRHLPQHPQKGWFCINPREHFLPSLETKPNHLSNLKQQKRDYQGIILRS